MKLLLSILSLLILSACQVKKTDESAGIVTGNSFATSITATNNIVANGVATSVVTINTKRYGTPWAGAVPTFSANGISNTLGVCSSSDASGNSTCTLKSTKAQVKSLAVISPAVSTPIAVTFVHGPASSTKTTITGTGPVIANGMASSIITVIVKDAFENLISGITPTFSATNTNTTNVYGACSVTDGMGVSTCSLKSTKAQNKVLSLLTPVAVTGASVQFISGTAIAANSTISGTTSIVANGVASSVISISFEDAFNNPVAGQLTTFLATDTGSNNTYGNCSLSGTDGIAVCSLKSRTAEDKILSIASPFIKAGGTVTFIPGSASAANSTIAASGPTTADGAASSSVTITLKDEDNNPLAGEVPTFSATNTGSTNTYGICSATDASGVSTCSLKSLKAELKTLSILTPVVKVDGITEFVAGVPATLTSTISGTGPVIADGIATSTITITLKDANQNLISGIVPTFSGTNSGSNNVYGACSSTDISGVSTCTLSSNKAESKILSIMTPISKVDGTVVFTASTPDAANSTITASGPTIANGTASATITITLRDVANNLVAGETPTFSATDTNTTNSYGTCSVTNASGVSTCTMDSLKAETKVLSILTPVIKVDGNAVFIPGAASVAHSSITGNGPVIADGIATSTISIILKDAHENSISGTVPTFSATDTGSNNIYTVCSATDTDGLSNCTLASNKAEIKTLSITAPISKADGTVTFSSATPVALNSTITASGPTVADGTAISTVTITLKDGSNNPVSGETPTFAATDSSATNTYGTCSATDSSGISTCTLTSLKAEIKTLSILTPVSKQDGTAEFVAGAPVAANSTIIGTGPVTANGTSTSSISITLKDINNNFVTGTVPTFSATDSGSNNIYGTCSSTNASGLSTCTLASSRAESKILSIATPVAKTGGTVVFNAGLPVAANSTISGIGPVIADGSSSSAISITLKDSNDNAIFGIVPTFSATDSGNSNVYGTCSSSDSSGISTCTLTSRKAELKTLSIATPINKADGTVLFTPGIAVASNSSISGTGPIVADGTATSTITVTLHDTENNPISGQVPTFSATDTSSTNNYSVCSSTNASGVATCTMTSLKAETKTLSILTPVSKTDGTIVFTSGSAVAANSTITGTSPVIANGIATSTISVTLKDAANNFVSGVVPTFSATDTGTNNVYGTCSSTDASGLSTCTLKSGKAEIKTLSLVTPVSKADGTVEFTAATPVASNSSITGTGPVIADGVAESTITITLKDVGNNAVVGEVPTFSATDAGSGNTYTTCSATNASGVSTCTLKSTKAEIKTLSIVTPISKSDGTITFNPGIPVATNSTITGIGPIVADGATTSSITITLKDAHNNLVSGVTPTFSATDTGATNTYGACSASSASGISTCTLKSTKAETKTLSIATPFIKADGTVIFTAGAASVANSTITGTGPTIANGTATATISITLKDASNNPLAGEVPTFTATNTGSTNTYGTCSASTALGVSTCTLKSTKAETKTLSIATPIVKADGTVVFTAGSAIAANSTITGTGPIVANGTTSSTVTITLKDAGNNPVTGSVPTFTATNTGSKNTYGVCSSSDSSGVSTCTLKSTKAETKTLSIATPIVKAGGTVVFTAGSPDPARSNISGTTPISADGISVSFITIAINDANSNPIVGVTPIFNATDTGSTNTYGACPATNASGVATCSLASTKAEFKTLQLTSPVAVTGAVQVEFNSLLPVAANSTITGTSPIIADGGAESVVTISLFDSNHNPVAGITPTFDATDSGSTNVYDDCSVSDAGGVSTCAVSSLTAETKTLRITTPVTKSDGSVVFTAGSAVAANSTISGTTSVVADGVATSTITIVLKDTSLNPVVGTVPTFSATNTGSTNVLSACSATNATGTSTCTLKSTKAESKIPQILTPVNKAGSAITFIAGNASTTNSTITGTSPVNPDGTSSSTITVTLKDAFSNTISGTVPTFSATGTNNTYGVCSSSTTLGVSTCTLKSTTAETKTLSIATPIVKSDGTVIFQSGSAVAANSTITGTGPTAANGVATSTITITLKDGANSAVVGVVPTFTVSGTNNTMSACSATNSSGVSTCTASSTKSGTKTLEIASPVTKTGGTIVFTAGAAVAANSSIVASTPTLADGIDSCGVIITLKDINGNPVTGEVPTYSVTGSNNTTNACTASDTAGESTCTVTSTTAEQKTFQLLTPVSLAGNTVDFNPQGINIQVPIEMVDRGISSNTSAITFNRTRTSLNTDDYVAENNTFMFELVANNSNTTTSYTVYLIDSTGATITDSAITVPPSTTMMRHRVSFTPNSGASDYRIRLPATTAAKQLIIQSARMIVEQEKAVETKIYIPLASGDITGEQNIDTNSTSAQITSTTSTAFAANNYMNLWQRNDAAYTTIAPGDAWTLETILSTSVASSTASAAIFDKGNNQQLTGAIVNQTGSTSLAFKQVSFPGNTGNFNDLDTLELRMKSSVSTSTTRIYKAGLWVKLKFLRKAEILFRVAGRRAVASTTPILDARFLWESGAWSNPIVHFQTNANLATSSVSLIDHASNDFGSTSPTTVSGSAITPTATYSIQRTAALTLTNMNRYYVQHTRSSGTPVLGGAFVVIKAQE